MKHILFRTFFYLGVVMILTLGVYNLFQGKAIERTEPISITGNLKLAKKDFSRPGQVEGDTFSSMRNFDSLLGEKEKLIEEIKQIDRDIVDNKKRIEELQQSPAQESNSNVRRIEGRIREFMIIKDSKWNRIKEINTRLKPIAKGDRPIKRPKIFTPHFKEKTKAFYQKIPSYVWILVGVVLTLIVSIFYIKRSKRKVEYEVVDTLRTAKRPAQPITERIKIVTNNASEKIIVVLKEPKIKPFEKILAILVLVLTFLNAMKEFLFK